MLITTKAKAEKILIESLFKPITSKEDILKGWDEK